MTCVVFSVFKMGREWMAMLRSGGETGCREDGHKKQQASKHRSSELGDGPHTGSRSEAGMAMRKTQHSPRKENETALGRLGKVIRTTKWSCPMQCWSSTLLESGNNNFPHFYRRIIKKMKVTKTRKFRILRWLLFFSFNFLNVHVSVCMPNAWRYRKKTEEGIGSPGYKYVWAVWCVC